MEQSSLGEREGTVHCKRLHQSSVLTFNLFHSNGYSRGQLGHGDVQSIDHPEMVEALGGVRIVQIAAGGWHSCALSETGDLYIWGWNESGQLGLPCRNVSGSTSTR